TTTTIHPLSLHDALPIFDPAVAAAFLDTVETRTFHYFWDLTNASNGLTPDRSPTPSFSSIAAVGFALTAYPIGVERSYITRDERSEEHTSELQSLRHLVC